MEKIILPMFKDGKRINNSNIEIDVEDEYVIEIKSIEDFKEKFINSLKKIVDFNNLIKEVDEMVEKKIYYLFL